MTRYIRRLPDREQSDRAMELAEMAATAEQFEPDQDQYGQFFIPFGEAKAKEVLDDINEERFARKLADSALNPSTAAALERAHRERGRRSTAA